MKDMAAMVLAAGLGTRLRPQTERTPKALVPVANRPMIHYPLFWLKSRGFSEVIINTHHFGEMLEAELGDGSSQGLKLAYSREEILLGTGGGIGRARKLFGRTRFVVINADTIIDADLEAMLKVHASSDAMATMAVVGAEEPDAYTPILVDDEGFIKRIGAKPGQRSGEGQGESGFVRQFRPFTFTGLSILEPALIDYLPDDRPACLVLDALIPGLEDGKSIKAYEHRGYWKALDNIYRIQEAEADMKEGRFSPGFPAP